MKHTVTDAAVQEYAERLQKGVPLGTLFPGKMSDCEFTPEQREVIRRARIERKALTKIIQGEAKTDTPPAAVVPVKGESKEKPLNKLRKMLYLQGGRCFFCSQVLPEEEASIEHLLPISQGGKRIESNEVVCHRSLNATFGHLDLKRKLEFIIRSSGSLRCPQ